MKVVIQRVCRASVSSNGKTVGAIKNGLLLFIGAGGGAKEQESKEIKRIAEKILKLRIFGDENDKMNLSVLDIKGEILVVPQFTLLADCSKGNRPYFGNAAAPDMARKIFDDFVRQLKNSGLRVETGVFGAKMEVELINSGPVTLVISD